MLLNNNKVYLSINNYLLNNQWFYYQLLFSGINKNVLSCFRLVVRSQMANICCRVQGAAFPVTWIARRTWVPARGRAAPSSSASRARRSRTRARARRPYWPPRRSATTNAWSPARGRANGICGDCKSDSFSLRSIRVRIAREEARTSLVTESRRPERGSKHVR